MTTHILPSTAAPAGAGPEHGKASGGWKAFVRIAFFLVLLPLAVCYALKLVLN